MLSKFKRILALITVIAIAVGMVYCINVSAESDVWEKANSDPTCNDTADGYTNIGVSISNTVTTKNTYNFLDNALYVENLDATEGKWFSLVFTSVSGNKKKTTVTIPLNSDGTYNDTSSYLPGKGYLPLLVRFKKEGDSKKLTFFFSSKKGTEANKGYAEELSVTVTVEDGFYIRFVQTAKNGYAMEVNGKILTHQYITDFCTNNHYANSYLSIFAESGMSADVKIDTKAKPSWATLVGMPIIEDKEDGSTYAHVGVDRAVVTNSIYNFEENAVYIENFDIPDQYGLWTAVTFSTNNKSVTVQPKEDGGYVPSAGFLPILIRVDPSNTSKFMVFVLNRDEKGNPAEQIRTAVDRSENLFIRFVKTSTGYAMQVNEKIITHQYITDFCEGGFHKESHVILHAQSSYENKDKTVQASSYMKGNVTIAKPSWYVTDTHKTPAVYKSDNNIYTMVSTADDSFAYATEAINFDSHAMLFKKINIQDGKSIALNFSKTANGEANATLNIEASGDKLKLSLGATSLGEIQKDYSLKIAVVKNGGNYAFAANDLVLNCGNALNGIFGGEVYASITANGKFSTDIIFESRAWVGMSGSPVISLNEKKASHIEVKTGDLAMAPYTYDVFTTGVSVSNLEISGSDDDGALIYFGKKFEGITDNASTDGIALILEKTDNGIDISLYKNSNGRKGYIGTVAEANEYNICFYWNQRTRTLKVNDTEFKFSKLSKKQPKIAAQDIESFLGDQEENLVYIGFSAIGSAKADLDLFYFTRPEQTEGVYIHTPRGVFKANGNDSTGYAAKTAEETYLVTTPAWDFRTYELQVDFKTVNGPVYLAVSKVGVSDAANFWQTGEGDKINNTGFVITPSGNTAQIAYYGANGQAAETVITTIDFDWSARHTYSISKAEDGNWYLYIDDVAMNNVVSPVFNAFMNSVGKDDVYFILGSKTGFYVDRFRFKKRAVPMVEPEEEDTSSDSSEDEPTQYVPTTDVWIGAYKEGNRATDPWFFAPLEEDDPEKKTFIFPNDKKYFYAVGNGKEDITQTAVQFNMSNLEKNGNNKYILFGLSKDGAQDDTNFTNKNATQRLLFRLHYNTSNSSNKKLNVKHFYNTNSQETLIATIEYFEYGEHTLDIRLDGNRWYLFVDGVKVEGSDIEALQDYIEYYGSEELFYCFGANGYLTANGITVIAEKPTGNTGAGDDTNAGAGDDANNNDDTQDSETVVDDMVYEDTFIDPNVETWHYYSTKRGMLEGNDIDGYHIDNYKDTWAYTDYKYDHTKTALTLKYNSTMVGEWGYFALCTSDYNDSNKTPKGEGDKVNRVILLMVPRGDSAEFQYWCINGTDAKATVIGTYKFDWSAQHTFDVRQSEDDGNWYFCVDGKLLISRISKTLNLFMNTHKDELLRYCYGAKDCLGFENAKVVLKPALVDDNGANGGIQDGDEVEEDYGFEFDFDDRSEEDEFEAEVEEEEEEIDPLDYLNKVKVKKRRLVSKAHGIIFTKLEIAGMIAGGVVVLAAAVFLVIFLIKKKKAI